LENRRGKDDEVSRGMWKEVESRKADKARMEEVRREGKKEREEKTDDRGRKNNSKNNGRKGGRKGRLDRVEGDR